MSDWALFHSKDNFHDLIPTRHALGISLFSKFVHCPKGIRDTVEGLSVFLWGEIHHIKGDYGIAWCMRLGWPRKCPQSGVLRLLSSIPERGGGMQKSCNPPALLFTTTTTLLHDHQIWWKWSDDQNFFWWMIIIIMIMIMIISQIFTHNKNLAWILHEQKVSKTWKCSLSSFPKFIITDMHWSKKHESYDGDQFIT